MQKKTGTVSWFDLTVPNATAVRDFYRSVVGWRARSLDMGGYSDYCMIAPATGKTVAGVCHARGVNTGLPPQWLIYIAVSDLRRSLERCRERGGTVVSGPTDMGGQGTYAVIRDPAGAAAALFQPPAPKKTPRRRGR